MSDSADQIAFALSRLSFLLRAGDWQAAGGQGLTPTQGHVLRELARLGPQRGADLARTLGVSAPTLSDATAALFAKGLILRHADPADRRAIRLALSPEGARRAAALPALPRALAPVLDALPEAEKAAMLRALTLLLRGLQEAGAMPVQRLCATCRHFRPHAHADTARPHHCAFVDTAFGDAALRIDCTDHAA